MPTKRQIQVGDRYYYQVMRTIFTVVGESPEGDPNSWILSSGGEGHTTFACPTKEMDDWRYVTQTGPDFKVIIESTWYTYGHDELFRVVQSNDSREAGPDSWKMEGVESHKTLYMHHHRRVKGEWLHVGEADKIDPIPVVRVSRYHRNPVI